ncbi:NACHT domain-containing protein [Lentzea flava]|uniref:NACHT N-terminal Helical domain-containing protein n=1 Tax=Lentzea flava TaxID=103732 RepID=A0ABQ2UHV1_9PSEU|nr:ATP-binding protein [Lentzea flava]MCP2199604.1 hypothetical protein [Lentzea flava]GGU36989.1 hypothetical protein GCM10010178_31430 [Lentzea flava]
MPPAATTLHGALLTLGRNDVLWKRKVDGWLGNVLTGTDQRKSMHAVFGWIAPGTEVPKLVREARQSTVQDLSSLGPGPARLELVAAVHTITVALSFFEHVREIAASMPGLAAPSAHDWHEEDRSFVSYLYSDDLPVPSAAQSFEAHLRDVTKWAAHRGERIQRILRLGRPANALLTNSFAEAVTASYADDFSAVAASVPEFAVWADVTDADITTRARRWLSSNRHESSTDYLPGTLRSANLAALEQPLAGEPHLPTIHDIYVNPHFRVTEAGPSARLTSDDWWSSEVPRRQDLELMLAGHLTSPRATGAPMLMIGEAGCGKSAVTRMLAAFPPAGEPTVVRVPLGQADPDLPVADQIGQALRYLTGDRVTWEDLSDHVSVVVLDGLDKLLSLRPNSNYLLEVVRFQLKEASRNRPVSVVITSRTSSLDQVLIPDGLPVVRLEPFDESQTRDWVAHWNRATATTPRKRLPVETVLAHGLLASQPLLLFMLATYLTDPLTPEPSADLSTTALLERLNDLCARRVGMEPQALSVAALGMFVRGRESLSETEFQADLAALGFQVPAWQYPQRWGPLADYQIASYLLDVLTGTDDELLFALLSHRLLTDRWPLWSMVFRLARSTVELRPLWRMLFLATLNRNDQPPRMDGYRGYQPTAGRSRSTFSTNLTLLRLVAKEVERTTKADEPESPRSAVEFVHRALKLGTKPIGQVTWSANGQLLTTNSGREITFWKITEDGQPRAIESHRGVSDVDWHPARSIAAIVQRSPASEEKTGSPIDTRRILVTALDGAEPRLLCAARSGTRISWSPNGSAVALLDPYSLRIVDVVSGATLVEHVFRGAPGQMGAYVPKPHWTRDGLHIVATHRTAAHLFLARGLRLVWKGRPGGGALAILAPDASSVIGACGSSGSTTTSRPVPRRAGASTTSSARSATASTGTRCRWSVRTRCSRRSRTSWSRRSSRAAFCPLWTT